MFRTRFHRRIASVTVIAFVAALLAAPLTVQAGHHNHGEGDKKKRKDIVDTAASKEAFKTLVTAVKAADLVEALKGKGPFTVFAPTNAAFEKLPDGTLESLLEPANKSKLQAILKYHVVPGKMMAGKVVNQDTIETLQGAELDVEVKDDKVMVGGAQVTATDVKAKNGVIHVIDSVMLPPEE